MPYPSRKRPASRDLETLDVEGIAEEWDQCEELRNRLRGGGSFFHPDGTTDDVQGCCKNADLLVPILTRMAPTETKPLAPVDPLRVEIDKLMTKNKRSPANAPEELDAVIKASWRLKKLLGFVKMKAPRGEVSTVT